MAVGIIRKIGVILLTIVIIFFLLQRNLVVSSIGAAVLVAFLLTGRRRRIIRAAAAPSTHAKDVHPNRLTGMMGLGKFVELMGLVALLAIIFSPSVLRIPLGGQTKQTIPISDSPSGMSEFLATLRQGGYHLNIANSSQQLYTREKAAIFIIGAEETLASSEINSLKSIYRNGTASLLIAEGNVTNKALLKSLFNATVTGRPIFDPTSPFFYNETGTRNGLAFIVEASLGSRRVQGVVDGTSAIQLGSNALAPLAHSSPQSYEEGANGTHYFPANNTLGRSGNGTRVVSNVNTGSLVVIAGGASDNGTRALLISDSAPFANYLFNSTRAGVDEKAFVMAMVDWVTGSNNAETIIIDNSHYKLVPASPGFPSLGLGIGPIATLLLEGYLSTADQYYTSLSLLPPFEKLILALLIATSLYAGLSRRYASDRKGRDDEPLPAFETSIVAQSQDRLDFSKTSRTKGFYIATLARLYDVLDAIAVRQFGTPLSSLDAAQLVQTLGNERAAEATRLFSRLSKISEYANGKKRFLFPPVLRWRSTVSKLTNQAESILNEWGLTISGTGESRARVEYRLRSG